MHQTVDRAGAASGRDLAIGAAMHLHASMPTCYRSTYYYCAIAVASTLRCDDFLSTVVSVLASHISSHYAKREVLPYKASM